MELTQEEKKEARELREIWKYNKIIRCPLCKKIYGCDYQKKNNNKNCPNCIFKANLSHPNKRIRWKNIDR